MIAPGLLTRLRVACLQLALCLLFCLSCATQEAPAPSGQTENLIDVTLRVSEELDEDDLRAAARRELKIFQEYRRRADLEDAAYSIKSQLRGEGYHFAEVRFETTPPEGEIVAAVLIVEEGPQVQSEKVELDLTEKVEGVKPKSYFKHLEGEPYRASALEAARTEVESAYLLAGFYEVSTELVDPRFSDDRKTARPLVKIVPGPRYTMDFEVPTEGLPAEALARKKKWATLEDSTFHVRRPAELASRLRNVLLDLGHQLARVSPVSEIDRQENRARVTLEVKPGPQLILRDLTIKGLDPEVDRTDPEFIRDVFDMKNGDVLGQKQIDRAVSRLYKTGIFGRVGVTPVPIEGDEDPRPADLEITLEELDARSVDFELGFGSYELLRAGVHYRDRNLFGSGRILDGALRGSLRSGLLETIFTDPYSFGLSNRLIVRAGAEFRDEPTFDRRSAFFSAGLEHELSRHASITGGYRFRFSDVTLEDPDEDEFDEEGPSREAGLFVAFRYDDRDNPVLPVSGTTASAGLFWSTPALLADLHFLEFSASVFHYLPLWDTAVLAFGARATTKQILNNDETLPIQERLFLGGDSSVRSFGEFELGPVDASGDPRGGLTSAELHVELRQKIVKSFHVAAFYDGGVVNKESFDFSGPYGHALGIGLRYYLPVGPVRLDFAYNPGDRFAADSDFMVHFGFGFTF